MEFYEAKTAEELENLNRLYGYFEDAMIVQMGYTSGDYVDSSGYGHLEQTNDLRVTFQRMNDHPFSIVLWFTHTRRVQMLFSNPQDNRLSDLLYAKLCRNDRSIFWTVWPEFDPFDESHIPGTVLIEAEGLKWGIAAETHNKQTTG